MSEQRTHSVTTTDGVTVGGTVHGQGSPVVFLPGGFGDADLDWRAVLPHVSDRFTCFLPSLRGRGLSDPHPDLGLHRLVEDLVAFVESLGEPAGLVGWSAGGMVLTVAAQSEAVDAVAAFEPTLFGLLDDQERASLGEAVAGMRALAADGDLTGAARAFLGFAFNAEELAIADEAGYFQTAGRYVPTLLEQLPQTMQSPGPEPDDPAVLGAISAPVLVVHGTETRRVFVAGAKHVTDHVADAALREIPGAGHAAPLTHPEALAKVFAEFFAPPPAAG